LGNFFFFATIQNDRWLWITKVFFLEKNSAKHGNQYFIANEENNANISHKVEAEKTQPKRKCQI
jgi:hypothetical protein